ncbi:MAG TPA: DUF4412 domain-containing protein [Thermoanaerobaculia bacterium]
MRRIFFVAMALAFASSLHAGITYRVETITEGARAHKMSSIAKVEGDRVRTEILEGDGKFFQNGDVMLGGKGSRVVTVLNPSKKTYYVIDFDALNKRTAETTENLKKYMTESQPVVDVKDEGDGGFVEGYPTHRYLVTTSTEIKTTTNTSRIEMMGETWTTDKLPAEAMSLTEETFHSGDPMVDTTIKTMRSKISGFVLKADHTSRLTMNGSTTTSKMKLRVTNIHRADFPPSDFVVPPGYSKVENPIEEMLAKMGR